MTFSFSITPEASELGIRGAFFCISGLTNAASNPEFDQRKNSLYEKLKEQYTKDFLKSDPVLQGFRDLHTKVGCSNRKFPAAPEALINFMLRKGHFPSINLLVDIYNYVSIESRLALGAHDISKISGNVQLKITDGSEKFIPLGSSEQEAVRPGEYSYVDDDNEVICRLEYKQVEKTKVDLNTKDCFYIIQGNPNTSSDCIQSAMNSLIELTKKFCGGREDLF